MQELDSFSQRIDRPPLTTQFLIALLELTLMCGIAGSDLFTQRGVLLQQSRDRAGLVHVHPSFGPGLQPMVQGVGQHRTLPAPQPSIRDTALAQQLLLLAVRSKHVLVHERASFLDAVNTLDGQVDHSSHRSD